jgi:hypothetical protein
MRHLLFALAILTACHHGAPTPGDDVAAADLGHVLESTPWLDHMPQSERDVVRAWIFVEGEGAYLEGAAYRGSYEAFRYDLDGAKLGLHFLDRDQRATTKVKLERFRERPFAFKLTLTDPPRGPAVYYGFESDAAAAAAVPATVRGALRGAVRPSAR